MRVLIAFFSVLTGVMLFQQASGNVGAENSSSAMQPSLVQNQLSQDVRSRDWSVNAQPSIRDQPPSTEAVTAYLTKRLALDWTTVDSESDVAVCAFDFVDLAHDGKYQLLISTGVSGRAICNELFVIRQSGAVQRLNAWGITDESTLRSIVRQDRGATTLVIPELWSAPAGMGDCVALWTRVYLWRGKALVDVSNTNPEVYKARLSILNKEIDMAPSVDEHDILERSCGVIERDRIVRFLGGPATTGLDDAEDWMRSNNWRLRQNATAALAEIHSNRALKDLERLAQDSDRGVALAASVALKSTVKP